MTLVADTRFLLVHTFPSNEDERAGIRELMRASLRDHLVVPSIVVTEYIKIAGKIIGKQAALNQISIMKESGAEVVSLDEQIAVLGGELALRDEKKSIGDTLIAATAISMHASHVVSDDPHFRDFGLKTKWK